MDSTTLSDAKRRVIDVLKRRGQCTASELAQKLGLTRMAAHQHLQAMEAQGWVTSETLPPQGRGRPSVAWSLSAAAQRELFPDSHAELTVGLIDAARQAFGEDGLRRLIAVRSEQQVDAYRKELGGVDLRQRVERLASIRSREGYMAEVAEDESGALTLIEHHCPICEAAKRCQGICAAELSVFRRSLGEDVEVERTLHLLGEGDRCAYRIRPAGGQGQSSADETESG